MDIEYVQDEIEELQTVSDEEELLEDEYEEDFEDDEYDKEYYCGTCGAKDGAEHPKTGYCFHCDTDNWIPKND